MFVFFPCFAIEIENARCPLIFITFRYAHHTPFFDECQKNPFRIVSLRIGKAILRNTIPGLSEGSARLKSVSSLRSEDTKKRVIPFGITLFFVLQVGDRKYTYLAFLSINSACINAVNIVSISNIDKKPILLILLIFSSKPK